MHGLLNISNCSYINCIIQVLANLNNVNKYILTKEWEVFFNNNQKIISMLTDKEYKEVNTLLTNASIMHNLHNVINNMSGDVRKIVNPSVLIKRICICYPKYADMELHCPLEFMFDLFNLLKKECGKLIKYKLADTGYYDKYNSLPDKDKYEYMFTNEEYTMNIVDGQIMDLMNTVPYMYICANFEVIIISNVKCSLCDRLHIELDNKYAIELSGNDTSIKSAMDTYLSEQNNTNKYMCPYCKKCSNTSISQNILWYMPNVLCIKVNMPNINVDDTLTLMAKGKEHTYELTSIICKHGDIDGYYYIVIKNDDRWLQTIDQITTLCIKPTDNIYCVNYIRIQ